MELNRKQVLQRLVMMKSYAIGEDYEALDYAISSLKTDEAYQIMYEGGQIFTLDEVTDILTNLKEEITNIYESSGIQVFNSERVNFYFNVLSKFDKTINFLRGNEDGNK